MNILLWILQVALILLCIAGGSYKISNFELLQGTMASMRALPRGLWMFLGAFETLAGLALLLSSVIKAQRDLITVLASAVAVESLFISGLYFCYRDFPPMGFTLVMAGMAGFIAYGRRAGKRA